MFVAPAGESHDIFDYIFRGRMMTEYQANPLVDVPADFALSTPYIRYLAWRKHIDTYGPVWEVSSASVAVGVRQVARWLEWWDEKQPVCPRSPESCRLLMAYITGYRLLATALTGLSGWLIASMVRHNQASLTPVALAAWLLNPLTLISTAVGAHNDAVMLVLVLLSWWLLQRRQPLLSVIVLNSCCACETDRAHMVANQCHMDCTGMGLETSTANRVDEFSFRSGAILAVVWTVWWLAIFAPYVTGTFCISCQLSVAYLEISVDQLVGLASQQGASAQHWFTKSTVFGRCCVSPPAKYLTSVTNTLSTC